MTNETGTVRVRDTAGVEADVIIEEDVGVVVRDGTRLSTRIFRPTEPGKFPVVLAPTAYGKDLGPDTYPPPARYAELPDFDNGIVEVSPWTTWEGPDPATWVPNGYAVVYLDVRGYHQSEGDASVLSPQDADDFYDVIDQPEGSAIGYQPPTGSARFTTTFDEDTELTGHTKLRLWVSTTDGSDIDLFVGLQKLDVNEQEVHYYAKAGYMKGPVAMGWLRVSERSLDENRSTSWQPVLSHDKPQPLIPGQIVSVDVEILPSSTLFRAGESLELVVQGADLFEHPALGHAYSGDINLGTHTIHTGGEYDSHLLVPRIPHSS